MDEDLDLLITGESRYSTINDCLEDDMSRDWKMLLI